MGHNFSSIVFLPFYILKASRSTKHVFSPPIFHTSLVKTLSFVCLFCYLFPVFPSGGLCGPSRSPLSPPYFREPCIVVRTIPSETESGGVLISQAVKTVSLLLPVCLTMHLELEARPAAQTSSFHRLDPEVVGQTPLECRWAS